MILNKQDTDTDENEAKIEVEEVQIQDQEELNDNEKKNDRPKRTKQLPAYLDDYEVDLGCLALMCEFSDVPKSYKEAVQGPKWNMWKKAVDEELKALIDNKTWQLVEKLENENVISNRWVWI